MHLPGAARPAGRALPLLAAAALLATGLGGPPARGAGRGEPGEVSASRVELPDGAADLRRLTELGLDVDGVFDGWARVHLLAEERDKLTGLGFVVTALPAEPHRGLLRPAPGDEVSALAEVPSEYHTYETLTAELQALAAAHPSILRLTSLGPSVQGRELWAVEITDAPDVEEDEPEVAYLAAMHGDEVVGKELCVNLIRHLVEGYGSDPRVTDLVDSTEIWVLPSMNPDGTALVRRYNAAGQDLNRDFPDQFVDPFNTGQGRQPETAAVMGWAATRSIVLAANFHGGALVANYPFDSNAAGDPVFSPTPQPDHATFVSISRTYADNNPPMSTSNAHPAWDDGVTNGADWYVVHGGMQDWAYVWHGTLEITLEVGDAKWPAPTTLPAYWDDNLESMLAYLERAREGLRGAVTDAETGAPLAASVRLDGNPFPSSTDPDAGDWHRPVLPGVYTLSVAAEGYEPQTLSATASPGAATRHDVALQPLPTDLQPVAWRVLDGEGGDGALDPAESADLAVTLRNLGRTAEAVHGRLVPTGWFADAVRPEADYPDVAPATSGESLAPHHALLLHGDVPAGHRPGFAVAWEGAGGARGLSEPFFLEVGLPSCASHAATDLPLPIVDTATTSSEIAVAAESAIDSVRVSVDVRHSYIGDLVLTLRSPQGTAVVLHSRSGGATDDLVGAYPDDLAPAQSLDALRGETAAGTWRLDVADRALGATGSLEAWSVELCGRPLEATTPQMRLRALAASAEGVRLDWWPYPGLTSYRVYRATDPASAAAFLDVTPADDDETDTSFLDPPAPDAAVFYLVTGVGPRGEGPKGHFGE